MTRRAARVSYDEAVRMIKAAQDRGLTVTRVRWGDLELDIAQNNEDSGEKLDTPLAGGQVVDLIREPKA